LLGAEVHSSARCREIARVNTLDESQIRVILLDIEGTTTPIDFVYKTLFPYASRKLESFVRESFLQPEIKALLSELRAQHELDERNGLQPPAWSTASEEAQLRSCIGYGQWLIARDSKCTPLKSLEGKIWQRGYESGELRGEVYPDVPTAFERWRKKKKIIAIYSSGSVLAQQQLFRSTPFGDLTSYISVFYDTRVGPKTEAESYKKIAASFAHEARALLFISDAMKEIEAARSAGMQAILCRREAGEQTGPPTSGVIHSFDEIPSD